jgi:hypothetical protein
VYFVLPYAPTFLIALEREMLERRQRLISDQQGLPPAAQMPFAKRIRALLDREEL